MSERRGALTGLWLSALAFGGLLAGHFLGFAAAAPHSHDREQLLAATGHASHGLIVSAGVAAVLAAVIGLIVGQIRTRGRERGPAGTLLRIGATLWALQSGGFVLLEAFERGGFGHLVQEPAFLLGLAAQILVAVLAAALIWLIGLTVRAIFRLLARPSGRARANLLRPALSCLRPVSPSRLAWNLRGPPQAGSSP